MSHDKLEILLAKPGDLATMILSEPAQDLLQPQQHCSSRVSGVIYSLNKDVMLDQHDVISEVNMDILH